MDTTRIIAFMMHDNTENNLLIDDVKDMLSEYNIGEYIIALENNPYRHFHICVEMDTKDYNAFVKKHLKDRLKLRGRAVNGKPRQYGRVLGIKKPDKMIAYTLKQGVFQSSLDSIKLEPFLKMSYTKDSGDQDREIRDKLRDYLDKEHFKDAYKSISDEALKRAIIRFMLKEKIRIRTCSQVDGYLRYMRQFSNHDYIRKNCELYFYDLLYNNF